MTSSHFAKRYVEYAISLERSSQRPAHRGAAARP